MTLDEAIEILREVKQLVPNWRCHHCMGWVEAGLQHSCLAAREAAGIIRQEPPSVTYYTQPPATIYHIICPCCGVKIEITAREAK